MSPPEVSAIACDAAVRGLLQEAGLPVADLQAAPRVTFLGTDAGGQLAGCVALEDCGDSVLLRSLAVASGTRGGGLATALVKAAEALARERGHAVVYLLTTDAAGFFDARGYARIDREQAPPGLRATAQFAGLCPASSQLMAKRL